MTALVPPPPFAIPDHVREAQCRAADPGASAWVSANAGAGKTKVLTDRVVRLLLAGAAPGRILCLTFTKAAAATMAIRVFERLGRWVTLDDEGLREDLFGLQGKPPTRDEMRLARRLFARAVETPGGLKIDTIHAFCERLLHLAPFEANVPARFSVLDEGQSAELAAEATAKVLADARLGGDVVLAEALDRIGENATGDALAAILRAALGERAFGEDAAARDTALGRLRAALGLAPGENVAAVEEAIVSQGWSAARCGSLADTLAAGKKTDQDRAASLRAYLAAPDRAERCRLYFKVFFTDEGLPRKDGTVCTKAIHPAVKQEILAEQSRVVALCDKLKAAEAVARTQALFILVQAVSLEMRRTKARLGVLDFQDLIDKTLALLARVDTDWVLYKLDRGIDHVLVDEAQDTNRQQWEILLRITADFTAGHGARAERVRTLFAVGDPKQSIFSFQGAEPRQFELTRTLWKRKVCDAELRFEDVQLTLSFRSGLAVLSAVDATFALPDHFRGLSFEETAVGTVHESARPNAHGLVELWPTETPGVEEEPDAWAEPVDKPEANAPPVVVAKRIAQEVRQLTTIGDEHGHVTRPGEVLILVRKRGVAFEAVIRALKEAGVPVAGADRLNLGEHIAVLDLVAAGRAALLEEDDLTLACALKSPLVGLSDDDLLRIAARRGGATLAEALRRHGADGDPRANAACAALAAWQDLARTKGPFGFYATLLGPRGGRAGLVARLGSEAGDAIDAFLCLAHDAEATETPSLTTFLDRFASAEHTIKRDLDTSRDEVRVMTVHGAKGLEAALVILIDDCAVLGRDPALVPVEDRHGSAIPVWSPAKSFDSAAIGAARAALRARALEEHNRLLYVAMTRAKDRLVIAPFRTGGNASPAEAWCEMIRRGLVSDAGGVERGAPPFTEHLTWRRGPSAPPAAANVAATAAAAAAPGWLTRPVPAEPEPLPPIRPSSALGAADRAARPWDGPFMREARRRGTLIHALLERLPAVVPERRESAGEAYIAAQAPKLAPAERARMVADALAVIDHEDLKRLFGPASRAEAAIAGRIETADGPAPVSGDIDRLAVFDDEVLLADYKTTTRPPPADEPVPAGAAAQLALYRALLQDLFPGRRVRAFLIWTSGPAIRELAPAALDDALRQVRPA